MSSVPRRSRPRASGSPSGTAVLAPTGQPSAQQEVAGRQRPLARGRYLPRIAVHNIWMVILLVVIVGKVGEWMPVVAGLPVLKIAFVLAAIYVNRVSVLYTPVRVLSLPLARPAIAFLTLSIVSIIFSVYKSNTLFTSYVSVIYVISFVMLVKTTQTSRDVERLLIGLAAAGCSLSIAELIYFHGGRAKLSGINPNDLAYALVTLLPIVLALRARASGWRRLMVVGLAVSMCMAVLLTASRGGALGLVTVLFAVAVFPLVPARNGELKRRNLGAVLVALGVVAALGTVLFSYLPADTQERLLTLIHPEQDYNASTTLNSSRRVIWVRDLRLAFERPIGYGMGSSMAVDGLYGHGQFRAPHNSLIQAFLELGVLGLYLYLATYYVAWRELGRISAARPRDGPAGEAAKAVLYARALRVALLGNFVAGFFLTQAYAASLWMIIAICCAFIRVVAADIDLESRQPRSGTAAPAPGRMRVRASRTIVRMNATSARPSQR
jgi:O-antigen ligase